jgi:hypothetical protein
MSMFCAVLKFHRHVLHNQYEMPPCAVMERELFPSVQNVMFVAFRPEDPLVQPVFVEKLYKRIPSPSPFA